MIWSDYFYYDESSPSCLRWAVDRRTGADGRILLAAAGEPAGSIYCGQHRPDYWRVGFFKQLKSVHRIIWELSNGEIPKGMGIDHIDGNGLNNRIENLRLASHTVNMRNRAKHSSNSSGVTGIHRERDITANGEVRHWWRAAYSDTTGKRIRRSFSVAVYGEDEAFRLAKAWREKMIEELNKQGAGYTERHGEAL